MSRYEIVEESQSAHCCFGYTVVDKLCPVIKHGKHYNNQYDAICETFDYENAALICRALNFTEESS